MLRTNPKGDDQCTRLFLTAGGLYVALGLWLAEVLKVPLEGSARGCPEASFLYRNRAVSVLCL